LEKRGEISGEGKCEQMGNKKPSIWELFEAVKTQSPSLKTVNGKWNCSNFQNKPEVKKNQLYYRADLAIKNDEICIVPSAGGEFIFYSPSAKEIQALENLRLSLLPFDFRQ